MSAAAMTERVGRLRARIADLSARPDVEVLHLAVGAPASAADLAAASLPDDLRAFYGAADGLRFAWRFRSRPLPEASIHIPALDRRGFRFDDDLGGHALLVDELQPEAASWYLYEPGERPEDAVIVFARAGEESGATVVAGDLGEYLDQAIEASFASYWPDLSEDAEQTVRRLDAPPLLPGALAVGERAVIQPSWGGWFQTRGVVEQAGSTPLVRLDHGPRVRLTAAQVEPLVRDDLYERFLAAPAQRWDALLALPPAAQAEQLARIGGASSGGSPWQIGPPGWDGTGAVRGLVKLQLDELQPRFRALFAPLPLGRQAEIALRLLEGWLEGDLDANRRFDPDGSEYDEEPRRSYRWLDLAQHVLGALALALVTEARSTGGATIEGLLGAATTERLRAVLAQGRRLAPAGFFRQALRKGLPTVSPGLFPTDELQVP